MQNRRDFLKFVGLSGLLSGTGVSFLNASEEKSFGDYKAIVFVYLGGGNDGINTFLPVGSDPNRGFDNYYQIRNNIRVEKNELTLPISDNELDLSGGNPYSSDDGLSGGYTKGFYKVDGWDLGFNALMPEVAHLATKGKVALFANMGNIIEPATKEELKNQSKPKPPFLFAHNHQTKLSLNGESALLDYTGWAGRVADLWGDINSSIYGLNIAISSVTHLFEGNNSSSLTIGVNGPSTYRHFERINRDDTVDMFKNFIDNPKGNIFSNLYAKKRLHSIDMQSEIYGDWRNFDESIWDSKNNAYGGKLFSSPSNNELEQKNPVFADHEMLKRFKAIARLAKIGKDKGLKRQIFFAYDGGYDTHNNQTSQHSRKLRGLSLALGDFYKALEAMEMENDVLVISSSDFGRSTGNNGDGSDHAWGSNYFALGGAIKGGVYGTLPDLTLGGGDDITRKGRLIPTTSMTQYYATACKWFGLSDSELDLVFPELKNFDTKNLGFC